MPWLPVVVMCAASLLACGESGPAPVFATGLVLKNAAGDETTTFTDGEPITFLLTVENRSDTAQTVGLSSSQEFDILVVRNTGGPALWQWSADKAFLQVPTSLQFTVGETKTFTVVWNQQTTAGDPLGIGEFAAQGYLATAENLLFPDIQLRDTRSPRVPLAIHP